MLSDTIQKHLNDQVAAELYSAYLYLGVACGFDKIGLTGFGHWLKCQYHEENGHALRIISYISDHDGNVELGDIKASVIDWECPCEAMRIALEHERRITKRIYTIMSAAREEADFATEGLLDWYVREQTEEESVLDKIVKKLEMIGENKEGWIWMDKKLGERPCHSMHM